MADDATQEPAAEPGQGSVQTSSATATADQPTAATSFPLFAFLPEEIRRMIWQHACFPTRIHYLGFPKTCILPPVGLLSDPARAPHLTYDGVRDDLAMLIANSDNYKQQWSVSGCNKFRHFYWRRDLNRVGAACPEARDAYLNLVNQNSVAIKKGIHVNESFDIFHFSSLVSNRDLTTFLLTLRPRLCPINIAIDIDIGAYEPNFHLDGTGTRAAENLPRWLCKAIEWGREAKEGHNNSPTTTLTPSIDDVAVNLKDLQAIYLVDHGIKLRRRKRRDANKQPSTGGTSSTRRSQTTSLPLAHQYNVLVHGMHRRFYGLSPENKEIMDNWDVPAHVWPVLREMRGFVRSSDEWKVNIYLMASTRKKKGH